MRRHIKVDRDRAFAALTHGRLGISLVRDVFANRHGCGPAGILRHIQIVEPGALAQIADQAFTAGARKGGHRPGKLNGLKGRQTVQPAVKQQAGHHLFLRQIGV